MFQMSQPTTGRHIRSHPNPSRSPSAPSPHPLSPPLHTQSPVRHPPGVLALQPALAALLHRLFRLSLTALCSPPAAASPHPTLSSHRPMGAGALVHALDPYQGHEATKTPRSTSGCAGGFSGAPAGLFGPCMGSALPALRWPRQITRHPRSLPPPAGRSCACQDAAPMRGSHLFPLRFLHVPPWATLRGLLQRTPFCCRGVLHASVRPVSGPHQARQKVFTPSPRPTQPSHASGPSWGSCSSSWPHVLAAQIAPEKYNTQ